MASRSISGSVVLLAVSVAAIPDLTAQEGLRKASKLADPTVLAAPGIRMDRLSPKQLRVWKAIEAKVFAKDASGRLRYPKLNSLWRSVETSGNLVYVELPAPKARYDREAGKFVVEKSGFEGQKHIAVIRLCLPVIDEALVRKRARGSDGFIRFEGLRKEERYAEILGHELAHAVWVLGDQSHARLLEELIAEVEGFERSRRRASHGAALDEQERQHLQRIEFLMTKIERPAEMAEAEVWKELLERREKH
jgi:hypothetical protein